MLETYFGAGASDRLIGYAIVLVLAVLIAAALYYQRRRRRDETDELISRELAVITERIDTTAGGAISGLLLTLSVIAALFEYGAATTVFQQITAGVTLIGGMALFGLGVAMGRRRTYTIYRSQHRTD
jgi:nucleoside permease NupC